MSISVSHIELSPSFTVPGSVSIFILVLTPDNHNGVSAQAEAVLIDAEIKITDPQTNNNTLTPREARREAIARKGMAQHKAIPACCNHLKHLIWQASR